MKQKTTFLILLTFGLFSFTVSAQTVNIEGDPYGGNPYATITDAIAASTNASDVILISGIITEEVNIGKSITLRGADPTTDIIQAAASPGSDGSGTRVIGMGEGDMTITIENLGIRYGNAGGGVNGGGINVEKVTGLVTLKNLIIQNNHTNANGGGITVVGSIVDIIGCTIDSNTSGSAGGGLMLASNNNGGAGIDSVINIKQSLINNNTANNGGGIYLNGNPGFGEQYTITANIENSTISNNTAASGTGGSGGGAVWAKAANYSPGGIASGNGNTYLKFIHATVFKNVHSAANKSGLQFTSGGAFETFFSAFNSIIVYDDLANKAINFANVSTTNVVNCILGGLINTTTDDTTIIDDAAKNNQKGKTATEAGLTGTLTSDGGNTQVIPISMGSAAVDYCTAATGETIPTTDQRGYGRTDGTNDAGAYEYGATTLSVADEEFNRGLKVYPNPAREFVTISSLKKIKEVRVYSILGVLENTFQEQNQLNISSLSRGVHILSIEADDSSKTTRRLVVY